ncbi:MAG: carbohydrate ABC transporter permease [Cyanobacteria bacterium]|nr:carbohydrate ABC transporter permease [Cyanobacteriota bacterium]
MKKRKIILYIGTILVCIIVFFPFYWLIITSLQSTNVLFKYPPLLLPNQNFFINYFNYITHSKILKWLLNSFLVSIISTILSTIFAVPGAYSISRFKFKAKAIMIFLVLLTQMLPGVLLVIPIYIIFSKLGLSNSLIGLVIIYTVLTMPIGIWFLKGFFDSIPSELEEAAIIDGCNRYNVLIKILIPLMLPGIVATSIWSFIIAWDEYLFAYTLINSDKLWVVSVGLASYVGQYSTPWNYIMSGAVLGTLPVVLLVMFFQRYLISGLTAGSVKG